MERPSAAEVASELNDLLSIENRADVARKEAFRSVSRTWKEDTREGFASIVDAPSSMIFSSQLSEDHRPETKANLVARSEELETAGF